MLMRRAEGNSLELAESDFTVRPNGDRRAGKTEYFSLILLASPMKMEMPTLQRRAITSINCSVPGDWAVSDTPVGATPTPVTRTVAGVGATEAGAVASLTLAAADATSSLTLTHASVADRGTTGPASVEVSYTGTMLYGVADGALRDNDDGMVPAPAPPCNTSAG